MSYGSGAPALGQMISGSTIWADAGGQGGAATMTATEVLQRRANIPSLEKSKLEQQWAEIANRIYPLTKKEKTMFGEVKSDMRAFLREHKSLIYWAVILYVLDHYCFEGAFKQRLQKIAHNLIGQVEEKLDKVKV